MKLQQIAVAALFSGVLGAPSLGKRKDDYSNAAVYQTNADGDVMSCTGGWTLAHKAEAKPKQCACDESSEESPVTPGGYGKNKGYAYHQSVSCLLYLTP